MNISVYSDLICPWCYIGKIRLQRAIKEAGKEDRVQLEMMAFQLYPEIPETGLDKNQFRVFKKSGYSKNLHDQAAEEGISFDFTNIQKIPNTSEAHRLIAVSGDSQVQLYNSLLNAHFAEGLDIGNSEILLEFGKKAQVSEVVLDKYAQDPLYGVLKVEKQIEAARSIGVTAVPSFVLDDQHVISGVLPFKKWLHFLSRI